MKFTRLSAASIRSAASLATALLVATAAHAADPAPIYQFSGYEGSVPTSTLVDGGDGFLYGTTYWGGWGATDPFSGDGTIFRIRPDGSGFAPIHMFHGDTEGIGAVAPLLRGIDGALYGATSSGYNDAPFGAIFRLQTDGTFSIVHLLTATDPTQILGALAQDASGVLYGTSAGGGQYGMGAVFSVHADGSNLKLLHEFNNDADGYLPQGGLTLGDDGRLYGTATGNWANAGSVFSIARDGSDFQVLHRFDWNAHDGANPTSRLVRGKDGRYYGTTSAGGASCDDCGTAFRIDKAGKFQRLYSFSRDAEGTGVYAEPALDADGNLYGTTSAGGPSGQYGTAWKLSADGKLAGVQSFTAAVNHARTGFVLGKDGMLYGGSEQANYGTVYRLDPAAFGSVSTPPPKVTIRVAPSSVAPGQRALLGWNVSDANAKCTASGAWSRVPATRERKLVVAPQTPGSYTYTLNCSGAGGSASGSATLEVRTP